MFGVRRDDARHYGASLPARLKKAHVRPLLKNPGLDKFVLNNYSPVSNLPYLFNIIERVVAARLSAHLSENNLSEPYQSAFKPNHSVETVLLCVQNDILKAMDNLSHYSCAA